MVDYDVTQNARLVNDGLGEELENYAVYAFEIRAIRVHSPGTKSPLVAPYPPFIVNASFHIAINCATRKMLYFRRDYR